MDYLKEMLSDGESPSTMRVMSFVSLIFAGVISIIGLFRGSDLSELAVLVGVFVGSAFAGKALQKNAEVKKEMNSDA